MVSSLKFLSRPNSSLARFFDLGELVFYWSIVLLFIFALQFNNGNLFLLSTLPLVCAIFLNFPSVKIKYLVFILWSITTGIFVFSLYKIRFIFFLLNQIPALVNLITTFIILLCSYREFEFHIDKNILKRRKFTLVLIALIGLAATNMVFGSLSTLRPQTYDVYLSVIETKFGFSSVAGKLFSHETLHTICKIIYIMVPVWLFLINLLNTQGGKEAKFNILIGSVVASIGAFGYLVIPAAGPVFLYGKSWPFTMADSRDMIMPYISHNIPRNCMPSLHTTWALIIIYSAWELSKPWFAFFLCISSIIILSTLGLGEHYTLDLIVAFPYSVVVWVSCNNQISYRQKCEGIFPCISLFFLWLLACKKQLFLGGDNIIFWLSVTITLAIPLAVLHRAGRQNAAADSSLEK